MIRTARAGAPRRRTIRRLITDIDGTLTDRRRRLDPNAILALHTVEERGIPVVLATGNVLPIALALQRSLGLSGPIVAENGGIVLDRVGGRERVRRRCERAPALAAFRRLRRAGLPVRRLFTDRWRETEVAIEPTVGVARIRRALGPTTLRVESTGFAIHLMGPGGGKVEALRELLGAAGVALADCAALGDGDNDVEMLRAVGHSVSFASASPKARAAAGYVARRSYSEGFVEGLIHLGLVPGRAARSGVADAGR